MFEITTSEAILSKTDTIKLSSMSTREGTLSFLALDVHYFSFNISYPNILRYTFIFYIHLPDLYNCRKWNRLCVSYDFQKNQAQVALSGAVSELKVDPDTQPNMNGRGGF